MKWPYSFIEVLLCLICPYFLLGGASALAADQPRDALVSATNGIYTPRSPDRLIVAAVDNLDQRNTGETRSSGSLAVIYPVLNEPYNGILKVIIDGIRSGSKLTVQTFPQAETGQTDLKRQLQANDVKAAIVLGRGGFDKIALLDKDLPVLLSGVVSFVEDSRYSAISIAPDPAVLFARLKMLLPQITKVHIVTNPKRNARILKDAREAAKNTGIELIEREALDLAAAAKQYDAIFKGIDGRTEAVWLTQDTSVLSEDHIVPMILEESWNRHVALFSSTLAHVPRGALFSAYPDNFRLGQSLAQLAASISIDKSKRIYAPLKELRTAVNVRTAGHLGINMSPRVQSSFDYTFPEY